MRFRAIMFVLLTIATAAAAACGGAGYGSQSAPVHVARTAPAVLQPPNGEPFGDTYFENYGVNPYIATEDQPFSTFAMDVDTASYTVARAYLDRGEMPPKDSVRVEEFVNYFSQDYASADETFAINIDGARSRFSEANKHLLRVGISGKEISLEDRRDAVLTFVIDVSGSMGIDSRLGLAKRSLTRLVDALRPGDKVGIVVYGTNARTVLEHTRDRRAILNAIGRLQTEGATNAEAGLLRGYAMATRAFEEGKINRVILISDGVANIGNTGADEILRRVKQYSNEHITLSTIGVGMANFNDVLMEKLADHGDGNYAYLDSDDEARALFGDGLTGLLEVIASDAKVQVEFNPATVDRYRLIGYENRALRTEDFEDDSVDAGEVGAGHTVTALYELRIKDDASGPMAEVRVRYQDPESREVPELRTSVFTKDVDQPFAAASPRFRFTAAVA